MLAASLAGFHVGADDVIVVENQQVGFIGEGGGVAAEAEGVLDLYADVVAALYPEVSLLVEWGGVQAEPLGLIEVAGLPGSDLVVGPEPEGPLAGVLAGERPWHPSGPSVGVFSLQRHGSVVLGAPSAAFLTSQTLRVDRSGSGCSRAFVSTP